MVGSPFYLKNSADLLHILRFVLKEIEEGILLVDNFYNIIFANDFIKELSGYSFDELESLSITSLLPDFKRFPLSSSTYSTKESLLKKQDGKTISISCSYIPYNNNRETNLRGLIFIKENILGYMLNNGKGNSSLGEAFASMAHEIRNPLAGMKTTAQALLQEMEGDEPKKEYISRIIGEIDRLTELLRNFFSFAKPHKLNLTSVNIVKVIDDTLPLFKQKMDKSGISLKKIFPEKPIIIKADFNKLKQVFINLISNAVSAMEAKGGILTIELSKDEANKEVLISIQDTGYGMPSKILKKIFDPFFTTKARGIGLGLSISYNIVKEHGGKILVYSKPNVGSSFSVVLPLN